MSELIHDQQRRQELLKHMILQLHGGDAPEAVRPQLIRLLGRVPYDESAARIQAFLEKRKATQPLDQPSCGSTFRNPPGDTAGRLIDAAGLKGFTIGGAQVSEKHANFVLNLGDATARDIRAVIEAVMAKVEAVHGVKLHPEVEIAGAW